MTLGKLLSLLGLGALSAKLEGKGKERRSIMIQLYVPATSQILSSMYGWPEV